MRLLRFIKRLFLVMVLLGVLFLTFIFRLMQAALSWFVSNITVIFCAVPVHCSLLLCKKGE
jgi:hypothetical protein